VNGVDGLRGYITAHPAQFVGTFTENLMSYGLGRGLEYYDMPTVRGIVQASARDNYRFSDIVLGIVNSRAFRYDAVPLNAPARSPTSHTAANISVPGALTP
jgi:hypothetical protein